jgi:cation channel sperm-associated protein 3
VLLLYVTAIIAFYFFGTQYPEAFGTIGRGMLNMLRVLTIDGWTDLNEELYARAGNSGTFFIIICIVLGNFLFSNIFVAIIIMNISEATDNFRDKQREQRDTVVRLKKEKVFRRQKLDLRQLFARQRTSAFTDFFSIGGQFQKLLRHDDLVAMADVVTSPLWIDSVYQSTLKANQTSNVLMNLHREMADNMQEILQLYGENKVVYEPITRVRYNRYLKIKAKLALLKQEILRSRGNTGDAPVKVKLNLE